MTKAVKPRATKAFDLEVLAALEKRQPATSDTIRSALADNGIFTTPRHVINSLRRLMSAELLNRAYTVGCYRNATAAGVLKTHKGFALYTLSVGGATELQAPPKHKLSKRAPDVSADDGVFRFTYRFNAEETARTINDWTSRAGSPKFPEFRSGTEVAISEGNAFNTATRHLNSDDFINNDSEGS